MVTNSMLTHTEQSKRIEIAWHKNVEGKKRSNHNREIYMYNTENDMKKRRK